MKTNTPSKKVLYIAEGPTLTRELMLAFKAECCRRGRSMTEVLVYLIREWLRDK